MKKFAITFAAVVLLAGSAFADSNRLSSGGAESSVTNFGYNDYVPENAFKNNLMEQGYSKVWDSPPAGVDVTEVAYYGRTGDPTSIDYDYVLTSEYNALNAKAQDSRINANASKIGENTTKIDEMEINVNQVNSRIADTTARLDDQEKRLKKLEGTQYKAQLTLMLHEAERYKIETYYKNTISGGSGNEVGVNLTLNIGKSYSQKQAEILTKRLERIEKQLAALEK
jgi:hypothetical protein